MVAVDFSEQAIEWAAERVKAANVAVELRCESALDTPFEPETVMGYHQLGLLSNETIRPFDRNRSGTVFGEGAASLVLERTADAKARGATVLGEFLGSGCVTEGTGITDLRPGSTGEGVRSLQRRLAKLGHYRGDATGTWTMRRLRRHDLLLVMTAA